MSDKKIRAPFRENTISYLVGKDFTKEEYDKWLAQIALWLSQTRKNLQDPQAKAKQILDAAINGTKLNGKPWNGVSSFTLDTRLRTLCSYDIISEEGIGNPQPYHTRKEYRDKEKVVTEKSSKANQEALDTMDLLAMKKEREAYKKVLLKEFPFLDNPVYDTQVNAYCDTIVKIKDISDRILGAQDKALETLINIRSALKKDLDDFMKLLKIHPSQIKDTVDEGDRGDVGALIKKWEEYGELGELYETVDAIQEAIQIIRQLENVRVDGSPQLADWLLWHKTSCRGHKFECECGREYELHGGFTKEEMYLIAEQAFNTFGYGIKRIEDDETDTRGEEDTQQVAEDPAGSD